MVPYVELPRHRPFEERSAFARGSKERELRIVVPQQMKLEQNNDTADEALFALDTFPMFLVGAFDAIGRAATSPTVWTRADSTR